MWSSKCSTLRDHKMWIQQWFFSSELLVNTTNGPRCCNVTNLYHCVACESDITSMRFSIEHFSRFGNLKTWIVTKTEHNDIDVFLIWMPTCVYAVNKNPWNTACVVYIEVCTRVKKFSLLHLMTSADFKFAIIFGPISSWKESDIC